MPRRSCEKKPLTPHYLWWQHFNISLFRWKACHSYTEIPTPLLLEAQNKALKETCPIHHLLAVMVTLHHHNNKNVYRKHGRNREKNHLVCVWSDLFLAYFQVFQNQSYQFLFKKLCCWIHFDVICLCNFLWFEGTCNFVTMQFTDNDMTYCNI